MKIFNAHNIVSANKAALDAFQSSLSRVLASIRSAFIGTEPTPALGPASTPNINALLLNLCEGDRDRALWVLRWLAYPLRHEGAKMATALLVAGVQGSGKSLFFDQVIKPMYAERAVKPRNLGGPFNAWMSRQLYVLVDDLRANSATPAQIKHMITDQSIIINQKAVESRIERNGMNFVFLTSDFNALSDVADNDRRFMVLTPRRALPPAVYTAVVGEIANGGIEAFHYFLTQQLELDDFTTRAALPSKAISTMVAA